MAVRFDASTDNLTRTTSLPSITSATLMAWCYKPTLVAAVTGVVSVGPTIGDHFYCVGLGHQSGTRRLTMYNGVAIVAGTATYSDATWYHVAMVIAGSGSNQVTAYLNGVLDLTTNGDASATAAKMYVGSTDGGDWFDGRISAVKVYSAVLTADEIKQEMRSFLPVRTANLNTWSPLLTHTDVGNYNNTGAWTVGGTLTTEDGPPIAWSVAPTRMRRRVAVAAAVVTPGRPLAVSQAVRRASVM